MYSFEAVGYQIEPQKIDGGLLTKSGSVYRELAASGHLSKGNVNMRPLVSRPYRGTKASSYVKFSLGNKKNKLLMEDATSAGEVDLDTTNVRIAYHNRPFVHLTAREGRDVEQDFEILRHLLGEDLKFNKIDHDGYMGAPVGENEIHSADITAEQLQRLDFRKLEHLARLHSIGWANGKDMEDPHVIALGTGIESPASATITPLAIYLPEDQHTYGLGYVVTTQWMSDKDKKLLQRESREFQRQLLEPLREVAVPATVIVGASDTGGPRVQLFTLETDFERIVRLNIGGYDTRNMASSSDRLVDYYKALLRAGEPGPEYAVKLLEAMETVHARLPEANGRSPEDDAKLHLGFTIDQIKNPKKYK